MNKEQMYDVIIQTLGHEHRATVWFMELAETVPDSKNDKLYQVLVTLLDLVRYAQEVGER